MPALLLAVPAEVIVSFAVLLLLYAFRDTIAKAMAWAIGQIPVVGGQLGTYFTTGVNQVVAWAESLAKTSLDALVQIVSVPVTWIGSVIGAAVGFAEQVASNIVTLFSTVVSLAESISANTVLLLGKVADVVHNLAAAIASIPGIAADVARSLIAAALVPINAAIAAAKSALAAAVAAESALIANVKGDLIKLIEGQVGVVSAALAAAVAALRGDIGQLGQAIDGEIGQVWDAVKPLENLLPLAASVPILLELVNIAEDCIIPQCDLVGPTLPILSQLGNLATLALVGAAVGEAVRDPSGAAAEAASVVSGIEGLAKGLINEFAGLSL